MTSAIMSYNPLKAENKNNLNKLSEIASVLYNREEQSGKKIGLISGKTGEAIFFFYYSRFTNEEKYADHGYKLLSEVFEEINNGFSFHTYAGGIAGIGWAVEHLALHGFIDKENTSVLDDLDDYLFNSMIRDIKLGNYDFLHGAIGIGIYFISRSNRKKADKYLTVLVDKLEKSGEITEGGGIKWESVIDIRAGTKGYNISLSHGISSIIVFLSKLYSKKIQRKKVLKLLNRAVTYLLQQQLNSESNSSSFPNVALESGEPMTSRLAWCYGDLGIGIALWQASQSTQNKVWEEKAIEILLHSTKRKNLTEAMVVDAGLCHGSAGIAQIYNRMYLYTGIKGFNESAIFWINETLKLAIHHDGLAGYKAWHTLQYGGWKNEKGFLDGVSGIGLTLISVISQTNPKWDSCLLLS